MPSASDEGRYQGRSGDLLEAGCLGAAAVWRVLGICWTPGKSVPSAKSIPTNLLNAFLKVLLKVLLKLFLKLLLKLFLKLFLKL